MNRQRIESHVLPEPGSRRLAPDGTTAVVVGGGIAGLSAACILAERGVKVTLLERDAQLGGRAASFEHTLPSGESLQMERGFHGFFRQYYNLRALLRRIDPDLRSLTPLGDYPILGPEGLRQTFSNLPKQPLLALAKLVWSTPYMRAGDLLRVDKMRAMAMLQYDPEATYARFDTQSADAYLDSLRFPPKARRMLFDVFAHSFFNPERDMSAGELLMMFHFYFTGNPEGLVFDVCNGPMGPALWQPLGAWLERHGASVRTGVAVGAVERREGGGYVVESNEGSLEADLCVLALDVGGLSKLLARSPSLQPALGRSVGSLSRTNPFGVLRLWLDRPVAPERQAFAGTTGIGQLDNISVYERFQDESRAWAKRTGGSVVELHAYAVPHGMSEQALRDDLIAGMHAFYPETKEARIVDEAFMLREDCPAFVPGSHDLRPTPQTSLPDLCLAGDFVRMPFPCALMERATASGFLAANTLLAPHGVAPEPLQSVPTRGLFADAPEPAPRERVLPATPSTARRPAHATV